MAAEAEIKLGRRTHLQEYSALAVAAFAAAAVLLYFVSDFGSFFTLETVKQSQAELRALLRQEGPLLIGGFFLFYVLMNSLSVPGGIVSTVASGAVFGLLPGLVIASFASAIGATIAFLSSRYLLRGWVQRSFGAWAASIDEGIRRDGIFYLLALRLNPLVPYFLVNVAMGLTAKRLLPFYIVTQIGMLPALFVYVNAGTQLSRVREVDDIFSPLLLGSLLLLSLFPIAARLLSRRLRKPRLA
jgi:uncharacterized membrane protein YdjX (TVP38/TMEM64 family)